MTIVSFRTRLNFGFGLTYLNLPHGRIESVLETVEEDEKVEDIPSEGMLPKRDLTDFLGVALEGGTCLTARGLEAVLGRFALTVVDEVLLPRRALIPVEVETGELGVVAVGEDGPDRLEEGLHGLDCDLGYKVGRVSSRLSRPLLKSRFCHSSMRTMAWWSDCLPGL